MEAIEASMEALLDRKLKELKTDIITEIEAKWGPAINKNSQNIAANSTSIEGHDEQLEQLKNDHKDKITELEQQLQTQSNELDDLKNRSLRCNVIIKGIPEDEKETKINTKSKLSDYLATLSHEKPADIFAKIDRAHRGGPKEAGKHRHIYANFLMSVEAERFVFLSEKHLVKTKNQPGADRVRVEAHYTKKVMDRRNLALQERRKLIDGGELVEGHIVYPAKLLGKRNAEQKYAELIKEF